MPESGSVAEAPNDTQDDVPLRMPDTLGVKQNFAGFPSQAAARPAPSRSRTRAAFFGTTADGPGAATFTLTYTDDSTRRSPSTRGLVPAPTLPAHMAIGPIPGRNRSTGADGAQLLDLPRRARPTRSRRRR